MPKDPLQLLTLLPGLEEAKRCIDRQIADIREQLGPQAYLVPSVTADKPKMKRNISEEVRQERREFLAKAREAKLARLYAKKAGFTLTEPTPDEETLEEDSQKATRPRSTEAA